MERFDRRQTARQVVENRLRTLEANPELLGTMDDFYKQAYTLLTSPKAQAAFTLDGVTEADLSLYGSQVTGLKGPDNKFHPKGLAEKLIVARKLVESGVRFVTVTYGGWDCHVDVKKSTLRSNARARSWDRGSDHRSRSTWLAGQHDRLGDQRIWPDTEDQQGLPAAITTRVVTRWRSPVEALQGRVYGASDATGGEAARDALPLEDLLFTIYHQLGVDANKELLAFGTRPIEIIHRKTGARACRPDYEADSPLCVGPFGRPSLRDAQAH